MNRKTEPGESQETTKLDALSSRVEAIGSRVVELSDLVQKLHISLDNLTKDANEDRGGVSELEESFKSLRASLDPLNSYMQGTFSGLASRVDSLEKSVPSEVKASELDVLKESVKGLHLAIADNAAARKALKERVKLLEDRAGAVR